MPYHALLRTPMVTMTPPGSLQLISIGGPESTTIDIPADRVFTIGRSMKSDFSLAPEAVSRQHAAVQFRGGRWILTDLESRHGTFLNSQQLVPRKPVILGDGDVIGFGPCTYRVSLGERSSTFTSTIVEEPVSSSMRIEPVERGQLDLLARQRLDLLVDCAAQIHGATDEQALAAAVLESALAGTRFHHAALLRPAGGDAIEVIAHKQLDGPASTELQFSRSLIRKAATGQVVRLTEAAAQIPTSMSIAALGITSALCAPSPSGTSSPATSTWMREAMRRAMRSGRRTPRDSAR